MKKSLLAIVMLCAVIAGANAQDLISRIPASSSLVLRYSGDNFSKNVSVQKLDSYTFVKEKLLKMLNIDTLTSIQQTGINFEQDAYQYMTMEDSALNFVTLLRIKNITQFLQVLQPSYKKSKIDKIEKRNGFEFLPISESMYIGWNNDIAEIVVSTYKYRKSYWESKYPVSDTLISSDSVVIKDIELSADPLPDPPPPPPNVYKNQPPVKKKAPAKKAAGKKAPVKKSTAKSSGKAPVFTPPVIVDDADIVLPKKPLPPPAEGEDEVTTTPWKPSAEDSIEDMKRDLWDQQQDLIVKKKQQQVAEMIFARTFTGTVTSIQNAESYKRLVDPSAHVSAWFNYDNILAQYQNLMYAGMYSYMKSMRPKVSTDSMQGLRMGMNLFFDKDKIRIEQKSYTEDPYVQGLIKDVMTSRQSASLAGLVNTDNIGYVSASINTEATAKYYYTLMKQYMHNTPYMREYSDVVDVYIDFLEIAIDEKGLSDLSPGNYLFVLHNMKTKMVDYTDYSYDEEYNRKEVKRSKKELSPDFTFAMETKNEAFMQKIAKLPLKYAEKEHYNYKDMGGYYYLSFDSTKYPLNGLYFMVKDGKVIVTTNKDVISMVQNNTSFPVDADTRKSILASNYSAKINSKKLIEILGTQASTAASKKMAAYLKDNVGDVKVESTFKDNMIQGTSTMAITGAHTNSLEFILNAIEEFNKIYESDRKEKAKRLD
jgi:hypothetical protein